MPEAVRKHFGDRLESRYFQEDGSAAAEVPLKTEDQAEPLPQLSFGRLGYGGKAGKYRLRVEGGALYVELRRANGAVDPRMGKVGPATILSFTNHRIGLLDPVILDLDGDGIELKARKNSKAHFDMDGDGSRDDTGWIGKGDGILVIDRNGDGRITTASELSLLTEKADALSGLHALTALDANGNGAVDAEDVRFVDLKVWRDSNGNGVSEDGEVRALAEHGITSISLEAVGTSGTVKPGANAVLATTTFTRSDGTTGTAADAALAFRPSVEGSNPETREAAVSSVDPLSRELSTRLLPGIELAHLPQPELGNVLLPDQGLVDEQAHGRQPRLPLSLAEAQASPPFQTAADYTSHVETTRLRLTHALAAFGSVPAMPSGIRSSPPGGEGPEWVTVSELPSIRDFLSV